MGVIYINDGFRKAKLPVDIGLSDINISGGLGLDISVEGDGNMVVSSENVESDKVVKDEVLNIL